MSTRTGATPICNTISGFSRSAVLMPATGAPKRRKAAKTSLVFSGALSIHKSKAFVKRGSEYRITANPPTTKYLAPQAFKHCNMAL